MHWDYPEFLFLLWILPLVAGWLTYAQRKRRAAAARFVDREMAARLMPALSGSRPWVKAGLYLAGLACLIVAGARPRFGKVIDEVVQRGADVMILLDVSRSMLAEDVKPSRLERAKSDVVDLLSRLEGDRVGLIVFAGAPVVQVPLTTDHGFFRNVLESVGPLSAPRGGSLIGDAIRKALEAVEQRADRDQVLILITDGEDHDSFPEEAARQAGERGVKIIAIGLGDTQEGARIPVRAEGGQRKYLQHDGQQVWSTMDEALLKKIAVSTQGAYIPARTRVYDLGQIYENHLADLTRAELQVEKRIRYRERFQLFAALGIVLLLTDLLIPTYARAVPAGTEVDA